MIFLIHSYAVHYDVGKIIEEFNYFAVLTNVFETLYNNLKFLKYIKNNKYIQNTQF